MWVLLDRISIEGAQHKQVSPSVLFRGVHYICPSSPAYTNRSIILSGLANFLRNRDLLRFLRATEMATNTDRVINVTFTPL